MRSKWTLGALAAAGLLFGLQAHALSITPATVPQCTTNDNDQGAIPDFIQSCFGGFTQAQLDALAEQYKSNVGGGDSGPAADWYTTTFANTATDPEDATIAHDTGDPIINCTTTRCFLFVKDGSQTPAIYAFEITGWNGIESIVMTDFWPNQGAISNVSIWSGGTPNEPNEPNEPLPEPGTLALLGLGLLGLGVSRRKRLI